MRVCKQAIFAVGIALCLSVWVLGCLFICLHACGSIWLATPGRRSEDSSCFGLADVEGGLQRFNDRLPPLGDPRVDAQAQALHAVLVVGG